ncbi:YhgE/Pip domain-containing protein [Nocardia sp. NPDC050175]|uniref:YhgE/Pip domain-containing protein n=1 Tax=Nocardia sp. NPDC050175 TaxID=3364317 RepID=UPI003795D55C
MRATALLRSPKIWVFTVYGVVIAVVLTMGYLGGVLDTDTPAQRVPIAWVDADTGVGAQRDGAQLDEQVFSGSAQHTARWIRADTEAAARELLARNEAYAAVVIPPEFTARVTALTTPGANAAPVPVTVLSNPLAGPAASGTAVGVAAAVLSRLSQQLGAGLTPAGLASAPGLLSDPVKVVVTPATSVPTHSAGGMAAFYYALVLILTGFLLAQLLHSGVDGALGFAPREFLHRRSTRAPLPIDRVHTLLVKIGVLAGCAVIAATVIEALAVLGLGMPAAHPLGLWLFSVLAVFTAGVVPLALLAVIGAPGALVATVVLVVFGVPSSGGAYPPELQPAVFRWLGDVLPMRHITDAARDLIFPTSSFHLTGAVVAVSLWLVFSLAFGLGATAFYDRTGRGRVSAHERSWQPA